MDAISFALGVQSRSLRSSTLKELIHRKEGEKPEDVMAMGRNTDVKIHFIDENDTCVIYGRHINCSGQGN
jgi:chromosome segregation ATPase